MSDISLDEVERRRDSRGREMTHALAEQLRVAKERHIVWEEMGLPDGGRCDVFSIRPSWGKRDIAIYEVKVSRADFWADVSKGKYRRYLPFCNRLFFVVPAGLVKRSEVPESCGLMTQQPHGGFRVVRPAPMREIETPSFEWMVSLLDRTWWTDTLAVRRVRERLVWEENGAARVMTHRVAADVREAIYTAARVKEDGVGTVEARNAIYLAGKLMELAAAAGIGGRRNMFDGGVTESDLTFLAESAVKLLEATDRVQMIGRYLAHLNVRDGGVLDEKLLGSPDIDDN